MIVPSKEILLSFCIPTYNRADQLFRLVSKILSSPRNDIEVMVLDNASADSTQAMALSISDLRFRYHRNDVNMGWHYNVISSLVRGSGLYSILLLDKDDVCANLIDDFCDFLDRVKPAVGLCEYFLDTSSEAFRYDRLSQKLLKTAYQCHHPTGYFFRTDNLNLINPIERFTKADKVGLFPFEFMIAELCLKGQSVVYRKPLFTPENLQQGNHKHSTHEMTRTTAFFSPKERTRLIKLFLSHMFTLPLPLLVRLVVIAKLYKQGLSHTTTAYRKIISDERICAHYNLQRSNPGQLELALNGISFSINFAVALVESAFKQVMARA
jgi:glycosyltransferase involved in cell wall biosynthesis